MNRIRPIHSTVLGGLLIACALPVHATFPGKDGRIAFVVGPDIYTMRPDGSGVKQLTQLGPGKAANWESWSPDGKQIVFNEGPPPPDGDGTGELWLMKADGSSPHLLLAEPDFNELRPSFTPDGSSVVFSRCRTDIEACALFKIGTDGTALRSVTDFELGINDLSPQYSPDGGSLAFTSVGRRGIIAAIYLKGRESTLGRVTPVPFSARQPDWSPDGARIAFSTHCCNPQNEEIWVASVEGHGLRRLTNNGNDYPTGPHDYHPSWSPQGNAIVFERDAPDFSSSGIFIMKADGSGCRKLMTLPTAAHANVAHITERRDLARRTENRHLKEIEQGGALPQWGVASK